MMNILHRRDDGTFVIERNGLPYHVVADDPVFPYVSAEAEGKALPPEPAPEAPEALPVTRIERRQGFLALLSQGIKRADIEAMIAAIADETEREIALAEYEHTHWTIESPFIAVGAAHFGMSEEQVQALFEHAATL